MTSMLNSVTHLRHAALFCWQLDMTAAEAYRNIKKAVGRRRTVCKKTVKRWYNQFTAGDFSLVDRKRSRRPEKITKVHLKELLNKDDALSAQDIARRLTSRGIPCTSDAVTKALHHHVFRQLMCTWLPKDLTPAQCRQREKVVKELLEEFKAQPEKFERLVTGDEKYVLFNNPKRHRLRSTRGSKKPRVIVKQRQGVKKVMICVWWDVSCSAYCRVTIVFACRCSVWSGGRRWKRAVR